LTTSVAPPWEPFVDCELREAADDAEGEEPEPLDPLRVAVPLDLRLDALRELLRAA
jgi:hypothetical protein